MDGAITEIDETTYLRGELMGNALFKYGSPELIDSYNTQFDADSHSHVAKKAAGAWEGINAALGGLAALNKLSHNREKALENLKSEILNLIRKGDLTPYGFKEPRNIADKPHKIPADLFFSGEINWNNSELKYRDMEFSGIRVLQDLNPIINLKSEKAANSGIKQIGNLKSGKFNFSDLEDDRYIDEKAAAEFLGIAVKTLQGYRVKGGGPEFRKIGAKTVRYKFSDLKIWAESRKKKNTSQH